MLNALQEPQTIVLFGGTSEIGGAIVEELIAPTTRTVVLACRHPAEARPLRFARPGLDVVVVEFEATDAGSHDELVRELAARYGDLDVAIIAFGVLGTQADFDESPDVAARAVQVNFAGGVSVGIALAAQMRRQGHGHLAVLSSVAAERARAANYVYGASKAGLDAFAQGLGDALVDDGVAVTVIRPGFVHTRMTRGRPPAPFATTPEQVAERAVAAMRAGRDTVWAPAILRYVFMAVRHLPRWAFRRLPAE